MTPICRACRHGADRPDSATGRGGAGRVPGGAEPVPALAAVRRRGGGDAGHGRRRARGPARGLRAEAELLRPGRGHRAVRRGAAAAVRAPRGAHGGADQRQGQDLLRGREHPDAGRGVAPVEGELLQVHQRDAQRHGGRVGELRAGLPGRAERHRVRGRLRARAGLRPHHADRRPLVGGVPAGTAAARGAARHRRADPGGRQAARAPRPGRLLRHQVRGAGRAEGGGLEAGRRGRAPAEVGRGRGRARRGARVPLPPPGGRARDRADPAGQAARRRPHRLPARDRGPRPGGGHRDDHHRRPGAGPARQRGRHPPAGGRRSGRSR